MKLTINLPAEEIDSLDWYTHPRGIESRSAAIGVAGVDCVFRSVDDYAPAWMEEDGQDDRIRDQTSSDEILWKDHITN